MFICVCSSREYSTGKTFGSLGDECTECNAADAD